LSSTLQEADITTIADDAWDAPVWREAALEYHESRGNRISIAPCTPEDIARLGRLMDDSVSLDRAWHELNNVRNRPAPSATLEALVFSLRSRGVQALEEPDVLRRLAQLDDAQARELKPHIASAWTPEDMQVLLTVWSKIDA
jgi:hypothetical protein